MTAPSKDHGLIFARGDFEYSPYLSLARGQKERGGSSSFGLKVNFSDQLTAMPDGPRYRPCCMIERGCYNYRWPFNEFCLHVDNSTGGMDGLPSGQSDSDLACAHCIFPGACRGAENGRVSPSVGTLSLLSFLKDGMLYQVLRLGPRCQADALDGKAELILTIEGPMRLQSFSRLNKGDSVRQEFPLRRCRNMEHGACLCSPMPSDSREAVTEIHWHAELFHMDVDDGAIAIALECLEGHQESKDHCSKTDDDYFSVLPRFRVRLPPMPTSTAHTFVARYRLAAISRGDSDVAPSELLHESISDFVRKGTPQAPGTAAMWQTIFGDIQERMAIVSEFCQDSVVGRCLEKILGVDMVPTTIPLGLPSEVTPPPLAIALVSNMFFKANVDLKSLL
jgi:hypothetical protein